MTSSPASRSKRAIGACCHSACGRFSRRWLGLPKPRKPRSSSGGWSADALHRRCMPNPSHLVLVRRNPAQRVTKTVHHKKTNTDEVTKPLGAGVHSAYEDGMVNANRRAILDALESTPRVTNAELIENGFDAAKATIRMMRTVFKCVPPRNIVGLSSIATRSRSKWRSRCGVPSDR